MKQNKTYKILTGLTLATILTTTIIGSTMANFTSAKSVEDSAKVASCTLNVTATDLFNKKYISDITDLAKESTYTVESDEKVLAPGTRNEYDLKVNGVTEFLVDATHSLEVELDGDWIDNEGNFYCPIEFKITKHNDDDSTTEYKVSGLNYSSKAALLKAISEQVVCHSTYDANYEFEDYIPITVAWNWPFSTSDANNVKDTALTSKDLDNPISLKIKCNTQFTQID